MGPKTLFNKGVGGTHFGEFGRYFGEFGRYLGECGNHCVEIVRHCRLDTYDAADDMDGPGHVGRGLDHKSRLRRTCVSIA